MLDNNYSINKSNHLEVSSEVRNNIDNYQLKGQKYYVKETGGPYWFKSKPENYAEEPLNVLLLKNQLISISKLHAVVSPYKYKFTIRQKEK